jgi:hypothetical protein
MLAEVPLFGALAPSLLLHFLLAVGLFVPIDRLMARGGFYRLVWHAALARFGAFLCLFSGLALPS